jgi:hypothetical protein
LSSTIRRTPTFPEGYELEVFAATGQTIAVVFVPASAIHETAEHEVLSVRDLARA